MARYQSGAVQLHTTDTSSAINIGGVTDTGVETGTETITDESGAIYDEVISIARQDPVADWTSKAIGTILAWIGLAGQCINSDGSHPGLRLYGRVLGDCKAPPAATDNVRYTIKTGLMNLGVLTANRGQDASLSVMADALTDGTNAPLAIANSGITLPTPLLTQQYTLGVCKIANVTMSDLSGLALNFNNLKTTKTPAMGSIWPDSVATRKVQPFMALTGFVPRVLDDAYIPLLGKQGTHSNTIIQLKRRMGYSSFYPNPSTVHVRITMNGIAFVPRVFRGSGNSEATNEVRLVGIHDGTNVPVIIDVASTYSDSL
jgi:hypothetical protein